MAILLLGGLASAYKEEVRYDYEDCTVKNIYVNVSDNLQFAINNSTSCFYSNGAWWGSFVFLDNKFVSKDKIRIQNNYNITIMGNFSNINNDIDIINSSININDLQLQNIIFNDSVLDIRNAQTKAIKGNGKTIKLNFVIENSTDGINITADVFELRNSSISKLNAVYNNSIIGDVFIKDSLVYFNGTLKSLDIRQSYSMNQSLNISILNGSLLFWDIEAIIENLAIKTKFFYQDSVLFSKKINEESLRMYFFNESTKTWQNVTILFHDLDKNFIEIETGHFSLWTIAGDIIEEPEQTTSHSGGGSSRPICNTTSYYNSTLRKCQTNITNVVPINQTFFAVSEENDAIESPQIDDSESTQVIAPPQNSKLSTKTIVFIIAGWIVLVLFLDFLFKKISKSKENEDEEK